MTDSEWGMDHGLWHSITAPFSPSPEDWALMRAATPPELLCENATPRILVLGVTHALIHAPWPAGSEIHAVDFDPVMIDTVWKDRAGARWHCADWREMPFPDAHFDLVVGDGSFSALPSLDDYEAVIREVKRVKKPAAPVVVRFFAQAEPRLHMADALDARFASYRSIARRLMAVIAAADDDGSARHRDTPVRIREQWGDVDEYLAALGQSPAEIERAKVTYEQHMQLTYPTRSQIEATFAPHFADIRFAIPAYDAGEHCPTVRFS